MKSKQYMKHVDASPSKEKAVPLHAIERLLGEEV
jgi:hypothetical protein